MRLSGASWFFVFSVWNLGVSSTRQCDTHETATISAPTCPDEVAPASSRFRFAEVILRSIGAVWLATAMLVGAAHAATLRIGLSEDPDALDPARGGSFV